MSETTNIFKQYQGFVEGVTSDTSKDTLLFKKRIKDLEEAGINFAEMDTAIAGIGGEAGEIGDLWKKIKFHGKPWNDENRQNFIDEAGDMFWYMAKFMQSLDVTLEEVLDRNVAKLVSRYPGGEFTIERSEVRDREIDPNYEGKNV